MVKVAICDDNEQDLNITKNYIYKYFKTDKADVSVFFDGDSLLLSKKVFDIYILDVIMPSFTGIEVADEINKINSSAIIIFLSSSPEFAVDSYKVKAFYYLLKPIKEKDLFEVLSNAIAKFNEYSQNNYLIKKNGQFVIVDKNNVVFIEVRKDKLYYHFANDDIIETYGTMKEIKGSFLSDKEFIQPHQSFIINMNYISQLHSDCIEMINETSPIPVSRNQYHSIKSEYLEFMIKKVEA